MASATLQGYHALQLLLEVFVTCTSTKTLAADCIFCYPLLLLYEALIYLSLYGLAACTVLCQRTAMAPTLESDQAGYNKRVVLASTIIVLFFSNVSYILRLLARRKTHQRLQLDDYLMGLALPFSYIPAGCLLYGE